MSSTLLSEQELQNLLGKTLIRTRSVTNDVDKSLYILETDLPQPHRILPPGAFSTCDWRPERLNIGLDALGKITRAYYG